jgi:hypothetical protein
MCFEKRKYVPTFLEFLVNTATTGIARGLDNLGSRGIYPSGM